MAENPPLRFAKGTRKSEANFAGDARGGDGIVLVQNNLHPAPPRASPARIAALAHTPFAKRGWQSSPSLCEGDAKERSEFRRGCTRRGGASPRPQQPAPRTSPSIPRSHRCACSRPLRKAKGGPKPPSTQYPNNTTPPSFPSFKIIHIIVQKNSARIATGAVLVLPHPLPLDVQGGIKGGLA